MIVMVLSPLLEIIAVFLGVFNRLAILAFCDFVLSDVVDIRPCIPFCEPVFDVAFPSVSFLDYGLSTETVIEHNEKPLGIAVAVVSRIKMNDRNPLCLMIKCHGSFPFSFGIDYKSLVGNNNFSGFHIIAKRIVIFVVDVVIWGKIAEGIVRKCV